MAGVVTLDKLPAELRARIRVDDVAGCWLWTGPLTNGYGTWRGHGAHRVIWELLRGPIPPTQVSDHICHDPALCAGGYTCPHRACVNPDHIVITTRAANLAAERTANSAGTKRRAQKYGDGREQGTHCPEGHEYTEANVYWCAGRNGRMQRKCRTCEARKARERYHRNLEASRAQRRETAIRFLASHRDESYRATLEGEKP